MLGRIQNDLFDLGADLATPDDGKPLGYEPLRIVAAQVDAARSTTSTRSTPSCSRCAPSSCPGGSPAAAALHLARTVARRAERLMVALAQNRGRARQPGGHPLHQPRVRLAVRRRPRGQ